MKLESKCAFCFVLACMLLMVGCDVSSFAPAPQISTSVPEVINVIVAQTAAAAAVQTAAFLPPTLTPTLTPFPTQTPPATPTITPTFIFILPTLISSESDGGKANSTQFSCSLVSQDPVDGTWFHPSQSFRLDWKVKNTGTSDWSNTSVDLEYVDGAKFTDSTVLDLPATVVTGNSVDLTITMTAPGKAGNYTTNWTMAASHKTFCALFLNIVVK